MTPAGGAPVAAQQDDLPAELKTPPLGLVALVGTAAVHPAVSAHLRAELRPPLHRHALSKLHASSGALTQRDSLSVASVDAAAQLFPVRKPRGEASVQARARLVLRSAPRA